MRIRLTARESEHEFAAREGEKILHAGLRAGLALPYECGTGTCGTCKAVLASGAADPGWADAPGRRFLKTGRDEILMCQAAARSDCALEVRGRVGALAPAPDHYSGRVAGLSPLNHNVVHLEIGLDRDIVYEAGQFMLVEVAGVAGARALSMAAFERPARRLAFTVKRIPGGALSVWLGADRTGQAVRLFGPLGKATFGPEDTHDLLVIAGGSGLGPMLSILARARACGHFARHRGRIYFGVRTADDLYGMEELSLLAAEFDDRVTACAVLSDAAAPAAVRGQWPAIRFSEGLVHEAAVHALAGALDDALVYMAGPPPMVEAGLRLLVSEARVPLARIRFDKFS